MISKATPAWAMLSRVLDRLLSELSEDDLSDLFTRIEQERTRRWLMSRRNHDINAGG
jgi:hypothetical protein